MGAIRSTKLKIDGMTCVNCENRIERKLKRTKGVHEAKVSYAAGTARVTYDETVISQDRIIAVIEGLDYRVVQAAHTPTIGAVGKGLGVAFLLLALYLLLNWLGAFNLFNAFPQAREGTGYGMLFVIGLLTSLHCVGMCGGINLSQSVPQRADGKSGWATLTPSLLYNLGRVISYTVIGGLVGAIGAVVSLPGIFKGFVQLAAGVFMVIMGLNMLGLFPWLRRLNPRMPKIFARKIEEQQVQKAGKSPLYVGLLNGLMPCGPLQAMQLYALSTGSPVKGALSMLLFSLGTVPLMFGLGAISSLLSKKFTRRMMTAAAALVVVLGLSMFTNGMSLSGIPLPFANAGEYSVAKVTDQVQTVKTKLQPGSYPLITVQKGIPVKWIIQADERDINGCNNEIYIPKYNIQKMLIPGDNLIEFTPAESGTFVYTCWMGMIRSQISVVEDIEAA